MKPGVNDKNVEIPITFDVSGEVHTITKQRIMLGILMIIGVLILSLIVFFLNISVLNGVCALIIGVVGITLIRYVWFSEAYFSKCYAKLLEHNFVYEQDLIWDIYDISDGYPAVCRYRNGVNAVFVAFDKDIIIGKGLQNEYDHYEAIADAYQYTVQKGISFMHIDYMDVVGKDERMENMVNDLLKTPNEDLRQVLAATFEYQQFKMNRVYASYDVYAFYYRGDDGVYLPEIDSIVSRFMNANFVHYRYLDMDGIRELVKSVENLPEFSVYKACDKVLYKSAFKKYVRVRKTFKNGVMTVVSKTNKEQDEERYRLEHEKAERRSRQGNQNPVDFSPIQSYAQNQARQEANRQQQQSVQANNMNIVQSNSMNSGNAGQFNGASNQFTGQRGTQFTPRGNAQFAPTNNTQQFAPTGNVQQFAPSNNTQQFTPTGNTQQFAPQATNARGNAQFTPTNGQRSNIANPFQPVQQPVQQQQDDDNDTIDW